MMITMILHPATVGTGPANEMMIGITLDAVATAMIGTITTTVIEMTTGTDVIATARDDQGVLEDGEGEEEQGGFPKKSRYCDIY